MYFEVVSLISKGEPEGEPVVVSTTAGVLAGRMFSGVAGTAYRAGGSVEGGSVAALKLSSVKNPGNKVVVSVCPKSKKNVN